MLYGCTKKINTTVALPAFPVVVPKVGKPLKNSEAWKVFKRLLDPTKDVCRARDLHAKNNCRFGMPALGFQENDSLTCACYETVFETVRGVPIISPQRAKQLAPKSSLKETNELFQNNQREQFPLSTVVVRWQLKKNLPGYDLSSLHKMLSKCGAVRSIRMTSPNSAIVVFEDLLVACVVVNSHVVGEAHNYLHSRFWHKSMENKAVYTSHKGAKVRRIPFL